MNEIPPRLEKVEQMIAAHGVAIMNIFPDTERGLPAFSYTVGLQDRGWPEILVSGIRAPDAHAILNGAVAFFEERREGPKAGEELDRLLKDYPCRWRSLSEAEVEANLFVACDRASWRAQPMPSALQLIYPDPEGRWPEDRAYSVPMALLISQGDDEARH